MTVDGGALIADLIRLATRVDDTTTLAEAARLYHDAVALEGLAISYAAQGRASSAGAETQRPPHPSARHA
jgi:hypothetical protein